MITTERTHACMSLGKYSKEQGAYIISLACGRMAWVSGVTHRKDYSRAQLFTGGYRLVTLHWQVGRVTCEQCRTNLTKQLRLLEAQLDTALYVLTPAGTIRMDQDNPEE